MLHAGFGSQPKTPRLPPARRARQTVEVGWAPPDGDGLRGLADQLHPLPAVDRGRDRVKDEVDAGDEGCHAWNVRRTPEAAPNLDCLRVLPTTGRPIEL